MKLKDYFNQKKQGPISAWDKLQIYQEFISKRDSKSFYPQRQAFFIKSFAYTFIFLFLLLWFYWTYIFDWKFIINRDWFFIQRSNGTKSVQADYIAKIIEFNGDFYIWHNGKYYQSSYISQWDIVTLNNWSELVFHIDQWTEAKVIWPAKFTINKQDDNYKLNLIYWDFIELKSLQQQEPQNIEISTQNIVIKQSQNKQAIDFQLSKDWQNTLLKNNWPQLTITQKNKQDQSIQKELNPDKILSITENDISIIEDKKLTQAIIQKNFTQTLSFNNSQVESGIDDLQQLLQKEYSSQEDQTKINENIWFANDKSIPTEKQMSIIISNLSNNLLSQNLQKTIEYYNNWDDQIYSIINNIDNKIRQINLTFNINHSKIDTSSPQEAISNLKNNIDQLYNILDQKYHIPTKYTDNLKQLSNQIISISNQ